MSLIVCPAQPATAKIPRLETDTALVDVPLVPWPDNAGAVAAPSIPSVDQIRAYFFPAEAPTFTYPFDV